MMINKKLKYTVFVVLLLIMGYYAYKFVPYKIDYVGHYDKIWAHRVNSLEKLASAINYFDGVEVDLVYDNEKNVLDVTHPPVPSIGLSFDTYLNSLEDNKPFIWLDIKNLTLTNADDIYTRIEGLVDAKDYPKSKLLVESRFPESLEKFMDNGYQTSYYLPYALHKKSSDELNKEIEKITSILKENTALGISTSYKDYAIISKHFPHRHKYIWITESFRQRKYKLTKKILKDETVKVVLISYRAVSGNR